MRNHVQDMIDHATRSEERIGVDGTGNGSGALGSEIIRLARIAASIHLAASSASSAGGPSPDRFASMRETIG